MPSTFTLAGSVFDNAGKAVSSADAAFFRKDTTATSLAGAVTNASGFWSMVSSSFTDVDAGTMDIDVQITNAATGAVGRIKFGDRTMQEAVYAREFILSPDSNDSTDANKGFFTTLLATSAQGASHTVTYPPLTGGALVTATAQSTAGAITLSSLETITTAGDITMSSGTLTVGGNFTVSSLGVVTSSGQITAASSLAVSSGGFDVGGGNFTVSSAGVTTIAGLTTINDTLQVHAASGSLARIEMIQDGISAAGDTIGFLGFIGGDSGDVATQYGGITTEVVSNEAGNEAGRMNLKVITNAVITNLVTFEGDTAGLSKIGFLAAAATPVVAQTVSSAGNDSTVFRALVNLGLAVSS